MTKKINKERTLKKVIIDFQKYIQQSPHITEIKGLESYGERTNSTPYTQLEIGIIRGYKPEYIYNYSLQNLAEVLLPQFKDNLTKVDIFKIIPYILYAIFKLNEESTDRIYVDCWYLQEQYINFPVENNIPKNFNNIEEHLVFFEEVIMKTLEEIIQINKEHEFIYELKIPFSNKAQTNINKTISNQGCNIEFKIIDKNDLLVVGEYKLGNIRKNLDKAVNDLNLITNILEIAGVLFHTLPSMEIGEYIKRAKDNTPKLKNGISFKYSTNFLENQFIHINNFRTSLYNFSIERSFSCEVDLFNLLLDKYNNTPLITASYIIGNERVRSSGLEFLKYWTALEVLLGSPRTNIYKQLDEEFKKHFPQGDCKEKTICDGTKIKVNSFLDKLWDIRCEIVHNGRLDTDMTEDMKTLSKNLFLKILQEK